jgi:hypothetical protein
MRLAFSSPASTLLGNDQKLRSRWCSKITLLRTRSTWPGRQSNLPNTRAHSCGAWLAHLPLTKRAPGVFGWRARGNVAAPSQFLKMEWLCSMFERENKAAPFFLLESQNRMQPLRPLFGWRVKRIWSHPNLVVRLPYNKKNSL